MLTEKECRAAQPAAKERKLFDGQGLHLSVLPSGYKSWRLKYRFGGKEKRLYIGSYPEISLKQARDARDLARRQLRDGIDPAEEKKRATTRRRLGIESSRQFETIARRWHAQQLDGWKPKHAADVLTSLVQDVFPAIGAKAMEDIRPADVRDILLAIQARGATETAHRVRARISAVCQFAIANDLAEHDPAAVVGGALKPIQKRMFPALRSITEARAFLRAMEAEPAHPSTKIASRLLALTAARPGMIRFAQLPEFEGLDGPEPIWRVPAEKMKLARAQAEQEAFEFILPLSRQAVETVKAAARIAGNRAYLFASTRHSHRPFSENALNANYRRVPGFEGRLVPHGWRATFSTIMNEHALDNDRAGDRAVIDLMLVHKPSGVESHYNRAAYMKRRRELAQEWADMLTDGLPAPDSLLEGPRKR